MGDTFDLRVSGSLEIGSSAWLSRPCTTEVRATSEVLSILTPQDYLVERIREFGCDPIVVETVGFASPFELSGDTVQFMEGDGNEVFLGPVALVTRDSLIWLHGGASGGQQKYVRRRPSSASVVKVEVTGLELRGDTTTVRYRVHAQVPDPEPFFSLTLPLQTSPVAVGTDSGGRVWRSSRRVGQQPVARWAYVGDTAFGVSPTLVVTALGVPELVDAWLSGYHEPFVEGTPQADSAAADTTGYQYGSRRVRVIGIGPVASTLTLDQTLTMLSEDLSGRCQDGSMSAKWICSRFSATLSATQDAIARNDLSAARRKLGSFKAELAAQRSKAVDETSYWLLTGLADVVLAGLPLH